MNDKWRDDTMRMLSEAGREYWRGVLVAGGFTAIPRWTVDPVRASPSTRRSISDDLVATLRRLADELAVSLSSVLLAAHAKVLAALSGEREVVTGYVAVDGRPTVAMPADDRTRFVAVVAGGCPSSRVGVVVAQGVSGR